jgi:hypothetical protein
VLSVQALVVDPEAPNAMRIAAVAEPTAGPTKALIEVHHVSTSNTSRHPNSSQR